ncbi:MAG: hypothetical protein QG635_1139 [Bacteroidota bacterium]|nr:hypothetical protein [Bacteroidota bacterium]
MTTNKKNINKSIILFSNKNKLLISVFSLIIYFSFLIFFFPRVGYTINMMIILPSVISTYLLGRRQGYYITSIALLFSLLYYSLIEVFSIELLVIFLLGSGLTLLTTYYLSGFQILKQQLNSEIDKYRLLQMEKANQQKKYSDNEERFKTIIDNAPIGVYRTTTDGNIIMANPALVQMLRYPSLNLLISKSIEDELFDPLHNRKEFQEKIERDGIVMELEDEWKRFDNTTFFVQETAWAVQNESGKVLYYDGIVEDVTERIMTQHNLKRNMELLRKEIKEREKAEKTLKESEERYRDLVEKAGTAILVDDKEGNITYYNKRFLEIFDIEENESVSMNIRSFIHPDDLDMVLGFHDNRINSRKAPSRYEFRGIQKDNKEVYLEADVALQTLNGKPVATRTYLWDITDRKKAEQQREELIEELHKALSEIKQLNGLLPICYNCKNIRDDAGYWYQLEEYISSHSDAEFSHGLCPDCAHKLYPQYYDEIKSSENSSKPEVH